MVTSNDTTALITIDGSGVVATGTNSTIRISTNGVLLTAATQANYGMLITGIVVGATAHLGVDANVITQAINNAVITNGLRLLETNVVWVSVAGNDATAARCRIDLPAQTVAKAKALAVAGDTVIVLPGTYYNCTNLLKGGVNWFGYGDVTLTYTNMTNTFDPGWGVFDDRYSGAVTSSISGFSIIHNIGFPSTNALGQICCQNTNTFGAIVITNSTSQVSVSGNSIYMTMLQPRSQNSGMAAISIKNCRRTDIRFNSITNDPNTYLAGIDDLGTPVIASAVGSGIYWELGDVHADVKTISAQVYALWCNDTTGGTAANNIWLTSDTIDGVFYVSGLGNVNYRSWLQCKELRGGVNVDNAGKVYVNAQKVRVGAGVSLSAGTELWFRVEKLTAASYFLFQSGGVAWVNVDEFEDLGTVDPGLFLRGGTNFINGGFMSLSNGIGIRYEGGRSRVHGLTIDTSRSTNSCVMVRTNNLVLDGCTLVNTNTKFSISSDVDATNNVRIYGSRGTSEATNKLPVLVGPWTVDTNVQ